MPINALIMIVKALKNIIFGTKSFKEGSLYDSEVTKGVNPAYFEVVNLPDDENIKTTTKTSEASIPKAKRHIKTTGRIKKKSKSKKK